MDTFAKSIANGERSNKHTKKNNIDFMVTLRHHHHHHHHRHTMPYTPSPLACFVHTLRQDSLPIAVRSLFKFLSSRIANHEPFVPLQPSLSLTPSIAHDSTPFHDQYQIQRQFFLIPSRTFTACVLFFPSSFFSVHVFVVFIFASSVFSNIFSFARSLVTCILFSLNIERERNVRGGFTSVQCICYCCCCCWYGVCVCVPLLIFFPFICIFVRWVALISSTGPICAESGSRTALPLRTSMLYTALTGGMMAAVLKPLL